MPPDPLVSIIIPYYNHPKFIAECVSSAQQQTYKHIEIIIVDDGSVVPIESALEPRDGVKMLRIANQGASGARNVGFEHSSGDFLIFLDSDDRLLPGAIQAHLDAFTHNPDAALSFGSIRIIDEHGAVTRPAAICRPRRDYFLMLLESNPIGCPGSVMIRRDAFIQAGLFNRSFRNADDYDLYLRLARRSPIVQHAVCVAEYRKHSGGKSQNQEKMLAAVMRILDQFDDPQLLNPSELRRLRHGRARWRHAFHPKNGLMYRLRNLYYHLLAMRTVPIHSLLGKKAG